MRHWRGQKADRVCDEHLWLATTANVRASSPPLEAGVELSAHRNNALSPRKRQPSWRPGAGLVSLLAGIAVALSGCSVPRLSADEVLDGPQTAQARSAAIARVEQWPVGLSVPGVSLVARRTYTTCHEGQNNWKRKDGYRLQCQAHSLVFLGWDGDYAAGRDRMLATMASFCSVIGLENVPDHPPSDAWPILGPNYSCSPDLEGYSKLLSGRATTVLVGRTWLSFDAQRSVSGPDDAQLLAQLKTRRWLFAVDVSSVFFQDQP